LIVALNGFHHVENDTRCLSAFELLEASHSPIMHWVRTAVRSIYLKPAQIPAWREWRLPVRAFCP
jgi:hypothetical protein